MKIMLIAGARPNFMKLAAVIEALGAHNRSAAQPIQHVVVHTGQHYDERMSEVFFRELALPQPDVNLGVGSSSHATQTAEIMKRFEPVLLKEKPDVLMVVGDVNSTVACSLVAAKLTMEDSTRARPLIAHVEAGLRSFDRSMPEEINRILTDALSDFLFITEPSAEENLLREGVDRKKIHFVGNTMVDTLLRHKKRAEDSQILRRVGVAENGAGRIRRYGVVTLHRPSNVDQRETFRAILEGLAAVGRKLPVFFPVHPRTLSRLKEFELEHYLDFKIQSSSEHQPSASFTPGLIALEPLSYFDFLCLMSNARLVLTDSGGIQEETTVLGVPCVTLRENTERPVTITHGTNVLAGASKDAIIRHSLEKLERSEQPKQPEFWDGHAGDRIIEILSAVQMDETTP
jgi:UDP-N-acetylglucosamine 2-epimerase (non-hydrolysing)